MPMRLKGKLSRHKKKDHTAGHHHHEKDKSVSTVVSKSDQSARDKRDKRLYVQCNAMLNDQYAADKSLGKIVYINDDAHPIVIDNEHFTGHAVFRVRDFDGWTPVDTDTGTCRPQIPYIAYFDGHRRAFSIQIQGRFKRPWSGDDVMFGTWFDSPLVLPRGYSVALAFANRIDPSMTYKVDGEKPYICSPLICAMNICHFEPFFDGHHKTTTLDSSDKNDSTSDFEDAKSDDELDAHREKGWRGIANSLPEATSPNSIQQALDLPKWRWQGGERLEENLLAAWPTWPTPPTESFYDDPHCRSQTDLSDDSKAVRHRRNWFLDENRRKAFTYHPDVVYSWDFFSPYVDVNRMQLKMGLTIDMSYYLDGQPLKYQARTRDGSIVFFEFVVGLA